MAKDNDITPELGGEYLGAFRAIVCRKCRQFWLEEAVPEICPQCGTHLVVQAGEGFGPLLNLMELLGQADQIVRCPFCGFRSPRRWPLPQCPRCKRPLDLSQPRDTFLSRLRQRIAGFF